MPKPPREISPAEERYLPWGELLVRWHSSRRSVKRMIARGELEPPICFGPGAQAAQRFALSAVVRAEQGLKQRRPGKWRGRRAAPAADTTDAAPDASAE
jgi:hypothetical protein